MLAPALNLSYFKGRMITKLKQILLFGSLVLSIGIVAAYSPTVFAAEQKCGDVDTSIIGEAVCGDVASDGTGRQSAIWAILILALNILTGGVGIAAVGGIVYGAVLYSSAGDKADQTKKAISIITNVVIGIIAYAMMYLVLNFLIPGGIFS
jgi:hypothetical protein